jgi:anthraniloyl-CoA monooxygenase
MKVNVLGGGPAGLYAALLLKKTHPAWEIAVAERNPAGATYGWGVVFSDQTLSAFREADYRTFTDITESFVTWEAIDIFVRDELARCEGHRFAGLARRRLLAILQRRCADLGVALRFETEVASPDELRQADLVIAADGVNSRTRVAYAEHFRPNIAEGSTRYIWFGTDRILDSFTFIFRENVHGLFTVHAYPFDGTTGTFIVECAEETWRRAGLDRADEAASLAFCEALFADHLRGRKLMSNYSRWLRFPTVKSARWSHENIVLLGDAAHTAHFSIGSGTKLAMEDAIALAQAFEQHDAIPTALRQYELARKPKVEALQRAAAESQIYFEHVARYRGFEPIQFAVHLLTRSGRITYDNLRQRDPHFVAAVDRWFVGTFERLTAPPAMWTPLALRDIVLPSRAVLAAQPRYEARNGLPSGAQAEQLASLARGGAGLVLTEPVAVAAEGRITPGCMGMYCPEHAEAWAGAVAAIHQQSPAKVAIQLSHAGRRGATRARARGADIPLPIDQSWPLIAPSAIPYSRASQAPRAMEQADFEQVCQQFVGAARLAGQAGFDMLVLNAAHGYLLGSFLSPLANARDDDYGGPPERRMRFPLEIFDAVRAAWPAHKPLAVAINASDWARGGIEIGEAIAFGKALKRHGCDLLAVYAGQTTVRSQPNYDPGELAQYSDLLRNETGLRALATGYLTTSDQVNTLVAGGRADLCLFYPAGSR